MVSPIAWMAGPPTFNRPMMRTTRIGSAGPDRWTPGDVCATLSGVLQPGTLRQQLARALNTAYADGLLSETTLVHRLDVLFGSQLIDPTGLVGDLSRRVARRPWYTAIADTLAATARTIRRQLAAEEPDPSRRLLALDWNGGQDELLLGRLESCDLVLSHLSVSRRHARLRFRDGGWVIQDLDSTNGTMVNDVPVGRCQIRPGDQIALGDECLTID